MNRGLALALLLLTLSIGIIALDVFFVNRELRENEELLSALATDEICTEDEILKVCDTYKSARTLLAVSVSEGYLNEYEEALAALSASVRSGETGAYVASRAEALAALAQIKRSALFSIGQIF